MLRTWSSFAGIAAVVALAAAACSASNSGGNNFGSGGAGGAGATGSNGAGNGTGNGNLGGGFTGSGGSSSSGGMTCNHADDEDGDGDGWTHAQGDCNDCDPNVNPGAIEVINSDPKAAPSDEDCDGMVDNVVTDCDANIALGDVDPMNGAKVIELCQTATANDKKWGVLSAKYTGANGAAKTPGTQVGVMDNFGPNVHPQGGKKLLVLSSGAARTPAQPGACGSETCTHGPGTPPPGFPQDVPSCTGDKTINDDIALDLKLRAPTNATGFKFAFKFHSFEFPEWVCTSFNDQFIALVNPAPMGSINGNISFDKNKNPVSVNIAFFDVCDPAGIGSFASLCFSGSCPSPPMPYCPSGVSQLQGSGFDAQTGWGDAGATSWLGTAAPIKGGQEFTIRFAIWDTGDEALDSTTLVDHFEWVANGGTVNTGTDPLPNPK
jgi:hypothetical protein